MEFVALAKNPVPSGAVAGMFKADDGAELRFARWEATRGPRRGTVCLFGGRAEFIEKYFEVVADLRRRGFAVATFDWRGQGGSHRELANRRMGHIRDFSEYDSDLARFMKDIVLPDCPPPFFALAHSMGGTILLRNACSEGSWFDRMVLCAPMLGFARDNMRIPMSFARSTAEACTAVGLSRMYIPGGNDDPTETLPCEKSPLTSDLERCMRNKILVEAAPHLALGAPTLGWLRAAFRAMAKLAKPEFAKTVRVPLLMFAAGDDSVVSTRQIEELGLRLKVGAHLLIPRSRHEILQETDDVRQRFWAAFDAYIGVNAEAA